MEENLNSEPNLNPEPNKKSNKGIFIVVALMAIIIVALLGYIIISNSKESKESGAENNSTASSKVSESTKEKDSKDEDDDKNTSKDNDDKDKNKNKNTNENTTNSTFGKKDKNTTNSSFGKKDKDTTNTSDVSNNSNTSLSTDWKSAEFTLDGKSYKVNDDYLKYTANGWTIDLKAAGYEDGYILNKKDKVSTTVDLLNSKFDDADINVGFINLGDSAKDITECQVWGISVDNKYSDTPVDFTLPGGIKNGSTLAEIEAAYGKPEEDDIYRSDDLGYTKYTYDNDLKPQLSLTVWDDGGLTEFEYKIY